MPEPGMTAALFPAHEPGLRHQTCFFFFFFFCTCMSVYYCNRGRAPHTFFYACVSGQTHKVHIQRSPPYQFFLVPFSFLLYYFIYRKRTNSMSFTTHLVEHSDQTCSFKSDYLTSPSWQTPGTSGATHVAGNFEDCERTEITHRPLNLFNHLPAIC